jgi:hypothetical protein
MRPIIKFKPRGIKKPKKKSKRMPPAKRKRRYLARTEKKYKVKPHKVVAALIREHGLIGPAATVLNMPRTTLMRYVEQYEVCREALAHAREGMGDHAESKLFELIDQGDVRCILYYLSTVHRARGYGLNNSDDPMRHASGGPTFVETVNIIGVPPGTFLPSEQPEPPLIEHQSQSDDIDTAA